MFEVYFFDKMLEFSDTVDMFLENEDMLDDYLDFSQNSDDLDNMNNKNNIQGFQKSNKVVPMKNKSMQTKSRFDLNALNSKITKKIIGQNEAVRTILSTLVKNNMTSNPFMKSNMILIGGTGNGKSETVKQIATELKIPYVLEDASKYTQEGYVGDSVQNAVERLVEVANGDIAKAEHGIIIFDEIDKKTDNGDRSNVATTSVQDSLLKMLEGVKIHTKSGIVDTSLITFILIGACENAYESRKKRLSGKGKIGFNNSNERINTELLNPKFIPEDLIESGFKSELIGRIDIIQEFYPMDVEMAIGIINDSEISIFNFYINELKNNGVDIKMNRDEVVKEIANRAVQLKTGARAIRQIVVEMFKNIYAELLIDKRDRKRFICHITKSTVKDNSKYELKEIMTS